MAKSTIEAEALGLGEAAEAAIYLSRLWGEITGNYDTKVVIKTDSKILERGIKSTSGVRSRRLRIDIAAIKEMVERGEIAAIEWVGTKDQVTDIFTQKGVARENIRKYVFGEKGRGRKEGKLDKNHQ